jgi:IS5 family transposase
VWIEESASAWRPINAAVVEKASPALDGRARLRSIPAFGGYSAAPQAEKEVRNVDMRKQGEGMPAAWRVRDE